MRLSDGDRAADIAQALVESAHPGGVDMLAALRTDWPDATTVELERGMQIALELISCRIAELRATREAVLASCVDGV